MANDGVVRHGGHNEDNSAAQVLGVYAAVGSGCVHSDLQLEFGREPQQGWKRQGQQRSGFVHPV
jgi:hypothetical protein